MDKVVVRKLRPWEGKKLHRMQRQLTNTVNSRHARIILLARGGVRNRHIGERSGCTPPWVRTIIHRFNNGGIDAITWYPYYSNQRGPVKFFAETVEQIAEVALSPPRQLIGMTVWSLPKLREYLIAQRIVPSISVERLRQILRHRKIRWRHTKTWKDSNDPEFWPKYRRIRRLYRRRPAGGIRLCIDEFGPLNILPRHGKHYAKTGHVDRRRATYQRKHGVQHFLAVYDLESDKLVGRFVEQKNWKTFLSFLRWVRRRYRNRGTLHVVLDNAGYHLKDEVIQYAQSHHIKFYFTPSGASWLNRIECHFAALRKFALHNTDYQSHDEQNAAIEQYLQWRNRKRPISIQDWRRYKRQPRKAA